MRSTRLLARLAGASTALALAASASLAPAQQQTGIALDRFDPAPAGDRFFGVASPYAAGHLTPHVMLLGEYAHNPLVLKEVSSGTNVGSIVSSQLYMHLNGGMSLWNRLNVNLDVPAALYQSGSSPTLSGTTFTSPDKVQFGDLRLGLRARIWGEYFDPFQIAVSGYLWFPTAASGAFVGDGQVRGMPQLIVGGRAAERVVWSAALGPEFRASESIAGIDMGSMFKWGAGVGVLLLDNRHLQLGLESYGALTPKNLQKRTSNFELLGDVRYRIVDDLEVGVGLGPGLTSGIGTPDFRGVFMIAYTPEQKLDRDGDGILDAEDACPDVRGVPSEDPTKNGCPLPEPEGPKDRDGDGILDVEDACPDVKGVRSDDPKKNGCPPPEPPRDRDGDGILDAEDACPDVKGVRSSNPKKNGCPPEVDTDGDGIVDSEDACPYEKGLRNADPLKNGCPRVVRVVETEIIILEQVEFDTAKATIRPVSDMLLDEVAGVFHDHPEILRVQVQGHTDNRGSPAFNMNLSHARADAVVKALIKRKIAKDRLVPRGYGQDKPIATNDTDEGRQKNRRVQFKILNKTQKPQAR